MILIREIKRQGRDFETLPFWASVARLLVAWEIEENISQLGQAVFALSVLLRTAAYNRNKFYKLIKRASLSELDVQNLLGELNRTAPAHLKWGLTWAELLRLHCPER